MVTMSHGDTVVGASFFKQIPKTFPFESTMFGIKIAITPMKRPMKKPLQKIIGFFLFSATDSCCVTVGARSPLVGVRPGVRHISWAVSYTHLTLPTILLV